MGMSLEYGSISDTGCQSLGFGTLAMDPILYRLVFWLDTFLASIVVIISFEPRAAVVTAVVVW